MPNQVRIIGGQLRGRKITFTTHEGLRPTHDRIRETLFNWLQFDIPNATCLDLFAGSGALGFEAASRGAKTVTFVDNHPAVVKEIKKNALSLALSGCEYLVSTIPSQKNDILSSGYDVVFLDPPYGKGLLNSTCLWLEKNNLLISGALIYFECEKGVFDQLSLSDKWVIKKLKNTQTIEYGLFQWC